MLTNFSSLISSSWSFVFVQLMADKCEEIIDWLFASSWDR